MEIIKLGATVYDKASGLTGTLIHLVLEQSGIHYNFQPAGLNLKTRGPLKPFWIAPARVTDYELADADIPDNLLGTNATDRASGFEGMITYLTLHINGCVHAFLVPAGVQPETGEARKGHDFDLRRLSSPLIPNLDDKQRAESEKRKPSPIETEAYEPPVAS